MFIVLVTIQRLSIAATMAPMYVPNDRRSMAILENDVLRLKVHDYGSTDYTFARLGFDSETNTATVVNTYTITYFNSRGPSEGPYLFNQARIIDAIRMLLPEWSIVAMLDNGSYRSTEFGDLLPEVPTGYRLNLRMGDYELVEEDILNERLFNLFPKHLFAAALGVSDFVYDPSDDWTLIDTKREERAASMIAAAFKGWKARMQYRFSPHTTLGRYIAMTYYDNLVSSTC